MAVITLHLAATAASAQTAPVYRIDTVAGQGEHFGSCNSTYLGNGGPATAAHMAPGDVELDSAGNLFIADGGCSNLYRVDAGTGISTIVARYRSEGPSGPGGDGGPASLAKLWNLRGIALDNSDNIFLINRNQIRRIDAVTGIITTIAGSWEHGSSGDGGPAADALFSAPADLVVDGAGNIFIADTSNKRIRRIDAASGIISTVAGGGEDPADGGPATGAALGRVHSKSQGQGISVMGGGR